MPAALYLAAYAGQGVIALLAGLFNTSHGLHPALAVFVPILATTALLGVAVSAYDSRRRTLGAASAGSAPAAASIS